MIVKLQEVIAEAEQTNIRIGKECDLKLKSQIETLAREHTLSLN